MNALSSMATTFRDHFTPSGRRASKPERQARKRHAKARVRRREEQMVRSEPRFW